jgi:ATP-dependent RNA helicase DDX1
MFRSGIYYFECTITGPSTGIPRLGWSTKAANLELGKDSHGFGYGGTAKKSFNNSFEDYGEKYSTSDTIGCLLDLTVGEISYTKNGQPLGVAFRLNPNSGTSDTVYFPAILLKGTSVELNFGEKPFCLSEHQRLRGMRSSVPPSHTTRLDSSQLSDDQITL